MFELALFLIISGVAGGAVVAGGKVADKISEDDAMDVVDNVNDFFNHMLDD